MLRSNVNPKQAVGKEMINSRINDVENKMLEKKTKAGSLKD